LTVRALLESEELRDEATENILVTSSDADRSRVRSRVSAGIDQIQDMLRMQDPDSHAKLGQLPLSSQQKEVAMSGLKKYRDGRVLMLARKVAAAFGQTTKEDKDSVIARTLAPNLKEMEKLHAEMYPAFSDRLLTDHVRESHLNGDGVAHESRRLSDRNDDVRVQVHSVLRSLEHQLGSEMPTAPSRMLLASSDSDQSFMSCLSSAVPNPTKVVGCITENMSEVIKMVTDFMKGK
jgi:hypothetical protein